MDYENVKQKIKETPVTKKPNLTGIPIQMKQEFEERSGLSFDDVRVHYHSDKPAKMDALAYTQGTNVYVGPGQERHLRHELGHVVQQKRGIVRPTGIINGMPLNDAQIMERDADRISDYPLAKNLQVEQRENYPTVIQRLFVGEDGGPYYNLMDKEVQDYVYQQWIVPLFNALGLSFFRIRTLLTTFAKDPEYDAYYVDKSLFLGEFMEFLKETTITVGRNVIPALRVFNITKMSRPGWTKKVKAFLEGRLPTGYAGQGTNVRHVIRNYWLKESLRVAEARFGRKTLANLAREILDKDNPEDATIIQELYRVLYRNLDNLWIGSAQMNQVIGFLASTLEEYGNALLQKLSVTKEAVEIDNILSEVNTLMEKAVALLYQRFGEEPINEKILEYCELIGLVFEKNQSLEYLAIFIRDMGATMGLDLIDDDSDDVSERTKVLIPVEIALNRFVRGGYDLAGLRSIYLAFLHGTENPTLLEEIGGLIGEVSEEEEKAHMSNAVESACAEERSQQIEDSGQPGMEMEEIDYNNCLIEAIAGSGGVTADVEMIRNIRNDLNNFGLAQIGEMLDGDNEVVVAHVLHCLGIDPLRTALAIHWGDRTRVIIPNAAVYDVDAINQVHDKLEGRRVIKIQYIDLHFIPVRDDV